MKNIVLEWLSNRKYDKLDIPCMYTRIGNPCDGYDYECSYENAPIICDSCVCNVETYGTVNPITGKQVNWFLRKIQYYRFTHLIDRKRRKKKVKRTIYKKAPKVLFLCDRRACAKCSTYPCSHTTDIEHARNFEVIGDTFIEKEM